ncbi:Tim44/TimA family putative adaptor protein [uncultured Sphingomonas sp.]|uniref:Tim44/TimA family putative adaptor protein n=1 Tax=uncultured Sphingomonas sp. TaxID=158754 RepID=UPI0035CA4005
MFYLVLFAMVAIFLGLRLYAVLGKRTGHEQVLPKPAEDRPATVPQVLPRTAEPVADREPEARVVDGNAQAGLRGLISADASFDVTQFLEGARSAYRMILEAFWKGDRETLGWLCEDHVRNAFGEAIDARTTAGHVLDNRLISIERVLITDAGVDGRTAKVTVAIDADIAAVTRDGEGNLVAGSLTDAVVTHDVWTFQRTLKSSDPNWKLADTDEA